MTALEGSQRCCFRYRQKMKIKRNGCRKQIIFFICGWEKDQFYHFYPMTAKRFLVCVQFIFLS